MLQFFAPRTGRGGYLYSSTGESSTVQWGSNVDIPVVGDYDGDKRADLSVFRPSEGNWYRLNSSNGSFVVSSFGTNGDIPLTGDFDGDGRSDLAIWRPATGILVDPKKF